MTAVHEHPHVHEGPHGHDHAHDVVVPEELQHHGPSYQGTAVLDIGGTIGAVVLHTGPDLAGLEIDLPAVDPGLPSTHSLVRERRLPDGLQHAAVYPALPEGRYRLDDLAGHAGRVVEVRGGHVTEVDWTDA